MARWWLVGVVLVIFSSPQDTRQTPERVLLDKATLRTDDGDTLDIVTASGTETVRILGIDTPEVLHLDHNIPYAQPFGDMAHGFFRGALALASKVELLRSGQKDPFGRTLGFVFLDNVNYSVLVLRAGLAAESVTRYGDNGLAAEAAECLAAAKDVSVLPFELPETYRKRMRKVSEDLKARGLYPSTGGKH
jgi:endonuclease YncB( thermonuclease family)